MKKRLILLISLFILVCLVSFIAYSNYIKEKRDAITGETVTGEATGGSLAISVSLVGKPTSTIDRPKNGTYLIRNNIPLEFTSNGDNFWYNLDNGDNTSITEDTTFNTTNDQHTLYFYANNSYGIVGVNITFTVDSMTEFRIYDDHFDEGYDLDEDDTENIKKNRRGESTEFFDYTYEELQNLTGVKFENIDCGKIEFNEAINISDDNDPSDEKINITININVSSNKIEINSTALPNFNKSATLHLYNLTFSNPRILRDGSVCPSTICTQQSYSGGTLIFNVTHFTTYSAEETPATPAQQPSGGGGSSGAVITLTTILSISPENIQVKLSQGEKASKNIIFTNEGKENLIVSIENPKLGGFIKISETNFTLDVGETKIIVLEIIANEDSVPDLYLGNLIINAKGVKKEIPIVIEIESKSPLFDVILKIPEKYQYVSPGEDVSAEISLYNLAGTGKVDVFVEYAILNRNGEEILREQETIAVETSTNFVRSFKLPENANTGKYFLYVKTTYNGLVASASSQFNVGLTPPLTLSEQILFIVIGVLIVLAFIIFFEIRKIKKHIGRHKIDEHALMRKGLIKSPEKIFGRAFKKRGK